MIEFLHRLFHLVELEQCPGRWYYTSGGCDGVWSCTECNKSEYGFGNDGHLPGIHYRPVKKSNH